MKVVSEKQRKEAAPPVAPINPTLDKTKYFLAEVCERIMLECMCCEDSMTVQLEFFFFCF